MKEHTTKEYLDTVTLMIITANSMKNEVSDIYWQDFEDKKHVFEKLRENACYWAPEIIRNKFWKELFKICSIHFNNASNPIHRKLFEIYQEKYNIEKSK